MKKFTLLLWMLGAFSLAFAQTPVAYLFSQSNGSYAEISDATLLGRKLYKNNLQGKNLTTDSGFIQYPNDIEKIEGEFIGFEFPFCNQSFDRFAVNASGNIYLGTADEGVCPKGPGDLLGNLNVSYLISCSYTGEIASCDTADVNGNPPLNPTTSISYKLEGSSPSQILTIQFKNILVLTSENAATGNYDTVNYQIKLHENGSIQYVFGKISNVSKSYNYQYFVIGLKGGLKEGNARLNFSDYNEESWENVIFGNFDYGGLSFFNSQPPIGLSYMFMTPPACIKPEAATDLAFSQTTSNSIEGSFQKAVADGHLVIISEAASLSKNPLDGQSYNVNDSIGGGKILYMPTDSTFSSIGNNSSTTTILKGGIPYYFFVYAFNLNCTGGPLYSDVVNESKSTLFGPPDVKVESFGFDSITLSITAAQGEKAVLIVNTQEMDGLDILNSQQNSYEAWIPTKILKVGDTVAEQRNALVIYKGDGGEYTLKNLKKGTPYWIRAYSVDESGETPIYATVISKISQQTIAELPITYNLKNYSLYQGDILPPGWRRDFFRGENFKLVSSNWMSSTPEYFEGDFSAKKTTTPDSIDLIMPVIKLANRDHTLFFDFNVVTKGGFGNITGKTMSDGDSLEVWIAPYGSKNYRKLQTFTNDNFSTGTAVSKNVSIKFSPEELAGQLVDIRFVFYTSFVGGMMGGQTITRLSNFKLEEVPLCNYPKNLKIQDSAMSSSSAGFTWEDQEDAENLKAWRVSIKKETEDEWSSAIEAEKPTEALFAYVRNLDAATYYSVRLQTVCDGDISSPWSNPSDAFMTQYEIPFAANMEEWVTNNGVSALWGNTNNPALAVSGNSPVITSPSDFGWSFNSWKGDNTSSLKASSISFSGNFWLLTPVFDLSNGLAAVLNLDFASYFNGQPDYISKPLTDANNDAWRFLVLISHDGINFNIKDTLMGWGKGTGRSLNNLDSIALRIPLNTYTSSKTRIALYVDAEDGAANWSSYISVLNFGVEYICPSPKKLEVSNILAQSVKMTWVDESETSDAWLVRYRAVGSPVFSYKEVSVKEFTLTELLSGIHYECGVSSICGASDSSKWMNTSFKTYICDSLKSAKPTATDYYSLEITAEGDAYAYKLRYRKYSASQSNPWLILKSETPVFTIEALNAGTNYEYQVQAQCSESTTDTSNWSISRRISTVLITCPQPTNFKAIDSTHNSIDFTWNSDANNVIFEYRKTESTEWDSVAAYAYKNQGALLNLEESTRYFVRMKAVCGLNDESIFTDSLLLRTKKETIPTCPTPTHFKAVDSTHNSIDFTWNSDADKVIFEYKKVEDTKWESLAYAYKNQGALLNLEESTRYFVRIKAVCGANDESLFTDSIRAKTNNLIGIETEENTSIRAFVLNSFLTIENLSGEKIKQVDIVSLEGRILQSIQVNHSDAIYISTSIENKIVIVKIYKENQMVNLKLFFR